MPHTQQNICLNHHFAAGAVLKIAFAHGNQTPRVIITTRPRLLDKGFYVCLAIRRYFVFRPPRRQPLYPTATATTAIVTHAARRFPSPPNYDDL